MATTPEGKVKAAVKKLLMQYEAYWHCPVQNGMGAPSLDFVGCHRGQYFAVETKAVGNALTARQRATADAIARAGGVVFVVVGVEDIKALEHWLLT